jgi:hypothetical protein
MVELNDVSRVYLDPHRGYLKDLDQPLPWTPVQLPFWTQGRIKAPQL